MTVAGDGVEWRIDLSLWQDDHADYAAVLDSGVRTPEEFAAWLDARALG